MLIDVGSFFVESQKFSENTGTFSLVDTIGLMDLYTFRDGKVYVSEKAGIILESIFAAAGVDLYDIDPEVYEISLSGHLEIQSCRDALKAVCFACGAVADDSRSDTVFIYKPNRLISGTVGPDRKISGKTSVELDTYVSGVSISSNVYTLSEETSTLFDGELPAGSNMIELSTPCAPETVTVDGGTIIMAKVNYVEVLMAADGKCTVSGKSYESNSYTVTKKVEKLESGEIENVKEYSSVPLCGPDKVIRENLESLLSFFQLRKLVSMEFFVETEKVGNWINIRDMKGNTATTSLISQDIDLAGGYIASASCRGYSVVTTDYFYTGQELMAGEEGLI